VLLSALPLTAAFADEGMYMPDKIANLPLAKRGLKISPNEIYNPATGGLSEAVVRLNTGCTGEFVSPDGLILTNHHCGYDALVAASTQQNNYGEVGYKANSRAEELQAKGYSINITLKAEDVTSQVLNGINATGEGRDAAIKKRIEDLQTEEKSKAGADVTVQIQALNNGLYYYRFNYLTLKDIRVVYAPPKSIGFYGGDPDNFEWTRHCGDFTFMRAYVGADGKPAEYSANNVPFKPRKFLTVNTEGIKENDFTMVLGYPAGTTRYRESYSVAFNQDVRLPFLIEYYRAWVDAWKRIGNENDEKRVRLQSDIFGFENSIKAYEGGVVAMRRANLVQQKRADEARFSEWVKQDSSRQQKYGESLSNLKATYDEYLRTAQKDLILQNMFQIAPIEFAASVISGQAPKDDLKKAVPEVIRSESFGKWKNALEICRARRVAARKMISHAMFLKDKD
jgi:hypothetical protein